jgi:glycosyltransferase involved in cell wall biosynthesis
MADRRARGRLIVLTRIWPTEERPSLGSYVRDRVRGVEGVRVVRPRWDRIVWPALYALLFVDAMRVRGPIRGIEAHMTVPTGLVGLVAARLRRVPLVVYTHGSDVRNWRRKPAPIRWLTSLVVGRADRIVTNSEDTAAHVRQMGVEPIVEPPGVDLGRFEVTPRPGARRVLYLGGRLANKGYPVAAELADTLVGPGLRDVAPGDIPSLMAEHDVVLMPSIAEGFGLVAVEAIASGRWVVASDVGGLRDIVIEGVNGALVADGDFAGALQRVPDYDPAAVAATAERYSLERWQTAMARIWDEVTAGPRLTASAAAQEAGERRDEAARHDPQPDRDDGVGDDAGEAPRDVIGSEQGKRR